MIRLCNTKGCQEYGEYTIYDGARHKTVCEKCYDRIFNSFANKGVDTFTNWAITSYYDFSTARSIVESVFGKEESDKAFRGLLDYVPMFTYGILKHPHNIERDGGINIVENSMVKGHIIYSTGGGGFPVTKVTGKEDDIVYGTYFEMPKHVILHNYDLTEGYSPDKEPSLNMYNREIVEVVLPNGEIKEANMYIANEVWFAEDMVENYRIPTGNYDDRYTHMIGIKNGQLLERSKKWRRNKPI